MSNPSSYVHPSAILDDGCEIGVGVKIWHFCHLMPGCKIGDGCSLGQNVFVANGVLLGKNVKVQNNVSLYEGVICEDDVFIGPSAVFTNVINPRSFIDRKTEYKQTIVRKGATIGANATIVCGNEIGAHAFIGAGAVITRPVLPYAVVVGNPAEQIGWISEQGQRLQFDGDGLAKCRVTSETYQLQNRLVHKLSASN
jgi:UDP-2-acetamido-3-amino-2,3-dideoxy-glucuronate N-acetyltransferase